MIRFKPFRSIPQVAAQCRHDLFPAQLKGLRVVSLAVVKIRPGVFLPSPGYPPVVMYNLTAGQNDAGGIKAVLLLFNIPGQQGKAVPGRQFSQMRNGL